jgi:hypothetical protein
MNYLKKNFPIFLLSGSLIFVGVFSSNEARGASDPKIGTLQRDLSRVKSELAQVKSDLENFKYCANSNFQNVSRSSGTSGVGYLKTCY